MNRTSGSASRAKVRGSILAKTKGFRGRRKNCYTLAIRAAKKAEHDAYIGRKMKKRFFKRLWNKLISIWARNNGTRYSQVIPQLLSKYGTRKEVYEKIRARGLSGDHLGSDILPS